MCNSPSPSSVCSRPSPALLFTSGNAAALPRRRNVPTIVLLSFESWKRRLSSWKRAAILLPLMLCVAGCSTVSRPSVTPVEGTPLGNSYRVQLPAGTIITLPTNTAATQIGAVAINELHSISTDRHTVTLSTPLQLVSPAYIAERNAVELRLAQRIADLADEVARLRNADK